MSLFLKIVGFVLAFDVVFVYSWPLIMKSRREAGGN